MGNDFITGPLKHCQTKLMIEALHHFPSNMSGFLLHTEFDIERLLFISLFFQPDEGCCSWAGLRFELWGETGWRGRSWRGPHWSDDGVLVCFSQIETNRASGSRVMSGKQLYRTNEREMREIREIEVTREQWYCFCTRIVHTNARLFSVAYESPE